MDRFNGLRDRSCSDCEAVLQELNGLRDRDCSGCGAVLKTEKVQSPLVNRGDELFFALATVRGSELN